jgi:hypothetical protein
LAEKHKKTFFKKHEKTTKSVLIETMKCVFKKRVNKDDQMSVFTSKALAYFLNIFATNCQVDRTVVERV